MKEKNLPCHWQQPLYIPHSHIEKKGQKKGNGHRKEARKETER